MIRNFLLGASAALFFLSSCDEKGPSIDFSPINHDDSTYTVTPPAPQPRKVLVEEYTGVQCTNCPAGTLILDGIEASDPGRLIVVSLHGGSLTAPIAGHSKDTLANDVAQELVINYFGEYPGKPSACIDRTKDGLDFFILKEKWTNAISERMAIPSPVNLTVTSKFNDATSEAAITVNVVYTSEVAKKQNLSIAIIESGIVDAQDYPDHIDDNYTHNHVFRAFVTPLNGSSFLDDLSSKTPGQGFQRKFVFPVNARWKLENCKVVAFVHNNEDNDVEVSQAAETPLKGE